MEQDIDALRGKTNYDYSADTSKRIIKVIGVGGGGGNAVTTMYRNEDIQGVTFLLCNTDEQALRNSAVPDTITLGPTTTKGLGAGNKPMVARAAAEESAEEIKRKLTSDDTEMVFVTAGMGGGTGTGAAPIVGKIARDAGKLTIGVVTIPFKFEGRPKIVQALEGVRNLQDNVDALLVVNNERLVDIYGKKTVSESFRLADATLSNAAKSISDIINLYGQINLDFADVRTTLKDSGIAVISSGKGTGNDRLKMAIQEALNSPLLNNNNILKARRIILAVHSSEQHELLAEELRMLNDFTDTIECEFESKFGYYIDNSLGENEVKITILASGFGMEDTIKSVLDESENLISRQERETKRAEEDKRIAYYYGQDAVRAGSRVRRPLLLTLSELDNEELLSIAEEQPALGRNLRSVEDIRRRYREFSGTQEAQSREMQTESAPTRDGHASDGEVIYFSGF